MDSGCGFGRFEGKVESRVAVPSVPDAGPVQRERPARPISRTRRSTRCGPRSAFAREHQAVYESGTTGGPHLNLRGMDLRRSRIAPLIHLAAAPGWIVGVMVLVVGCATSVPPRLLDLDQPISLDPGQGILVVEVDASEPVLRLLIESHERFASSVTLENLAAGRRAKLLVLPAGRYRWREVDMKGDVKINGRTYPVTWRIDAADEHWQFDVRAGAVNYPGLVYLHRVDRLGLRMYTLNRSAQLVQTIRESRDALLVEHPIVYSGRGRDDFLEFYASKSGHAAGSKQERDEPAVDPK